MTAFFQPIAAAPARDLLDRYAYASPRMKVSFVDPQTRPGLVKELGADPSKLANGLLVVKLGEEKTEVTELNEVPVA